MAPVFYCRCTNCYCSATVLHTQRVDIEFKNLLRAEKDATLTLKSEAGRAVTLALFCLNLVTNNIFPEMGLQDRGAVKNVQLLVRKKKLLKKLHVRTKKLLKKLLFRKKKLLKRLLVRKKKLLKKLLLQKHWKH